MRSANGCEDVVMGSHLVSVGYEGRDVAELVESLVDQGVSTLVDVRLTPLSRKRGLSKRRLQAALAEREIRYVHLPALGNPKDNRAGFRAGQPQSRHRFAALLRTDEGELALSHVAELLDDQTVALLCFERCHTDCHRQLVAERLRGALPELTLVTV